MSGSGSNASFNSHSETPMMLYLQLIYLMDNYLPMARRKLRAILPVIELSAALARLPRAVWLESLWCVAAFSRSNLPDLVERTRLAVPLCVFSFGIWITPYHYTQVAASHNWFLICNRDI